MSLVSTWCKCRDNCWYENPIWEDKDWFINLDDDQDPEFVVKSKIVLENPTDNKFDWFEINSNWNTECERWFKDNKFYPARSCFVDIIKLPTKPNKYDKKLKHKSMKGDFCYYDFSKKGEKNDKN